MSSQSNERIASTLPPHGLSLRSALFERGVLAERHSARLPTNSFDAPPSSTFLGYADKHAPTALCDEPFTAAAVYGNRLNDRFSRPTYLSKDSHQQSTCANENDFFFNKAAVLFFFVLLTNQMISEKRKRKKKKEKGSVVSRNGSASEVEGRVTSHYLKCPYCHRTPRRACFMYFLLSVISFFLVRKSQLHPSPSKVTAPTHGNLSIVRARHSRLKHFNQPTFTVCFSPGFVFNVSLIRACI